MKFRLLRSMRLAAFVVSGLAFSTLGLAQETRPAAAGKASATLLDAKGAEVGTVTFAEEAGGVKVRVKVKGLSAGEHAFHIHAVGSCTAPDFKDAGAHFNPANKQHGKDNPEGHHAGDMPNLVVQEDGAGTMDYVAAGVTLAAGENSLFDKDGSAAVVHVSPDDYKTDPTGNAGDRIACGIVKVAE